MNNSNQHNGFGKNKMGAQLIAGAALGFDGIAPRSFWKWECFDKDGVLKWVDEAPNLITNEGRFEILDKYFKLAALPAAWYVGIIEDTGFSAIANADTLASHAGWTECTAYSGNRKTWTPGSITGTTTASVDNSGAVASFAINATKTIKGGFICTVNTGTSGKLYAAALFSGGDRAVVNGDTLNVTVTITQT